MLDSESGDVNSHRSKINGRTEERDGFIYLFISKYIRTNGCENTLVNLTLLERADL